MCMPRASLHPRPSCTFTLSISRRRRWARPFARPLPTACMGMPGPPGRPFRLSYQPSGAALQAAHCPTSSESPNMSRQYGPQTVAAGARMTFPIGKNAANVYIRNRSPFILRVWFGSDAPSDAMPTTAWHADVGPWEASPLGVLGGFHQAYRNIATYSNPAGFDGTVTLVAVTLDQSATITTATQYSVTLTSYEAAEAVPQPTATGTPQTITSGNQRVVSVPIVPQGGAVVFGTPPPGSGQPIVTSPTLGSIGDFAQPVTGLINPATF